jgi:hypothetical protein
MRLKSSQATDRNTCGEAAFYNVSHEVAFAVFVVGCAYLFGRENASELKETFYRVVEIDGPWMRGYIKPMNLPASTQGLRFSENVNN